MSELAQGQGIAVSTMTEVVARLAEQGLLSKSTTNADRREVRVAITELGLDRLDRTLEERNRILGERLAVLTEGEQRSIAAAIPALWKLAAIDAAEWPRVPLKPDGKKRRADRNTAGS
ncbi:MAG: hypothetical protein ABS81_02675 [Pseudonocardia sp. SCN 72-86]|nr:MAG: hypothetical protein ABS81_02675 [Pseudonocardia sp. SCN 72-86]